MNIYFWIILSALLLNYFIDLIADYLNLRYLQSQLPDEFKDIYDEDVYRKSQEYTKIKTKFGFITSTFNLLLILIFWFFEGFNYLDLFLRQSFTNEIILGVIYIGLLIFVSSLINLPFNIYSTFVIEERFGFNKTTIKVFVSDLLKSLGLSIVLGVPVLALILYLFNEIGDYAWFYSWLSIALISLILQYLAPRWIMPLFNKFEPLEDGELKSAIMDYAKSVNFSLNNVYVMDGSKRSTKSNAFFTGFGKNKKIALFDTLIEKHTVVELVGVLAHEIGHYKKKHIIQAMIISLLHTGIIFYLLSIFTKTPELFEAFGMENQSVYSGLIFFGMLYSSIEMILSILMNILSRKNEYEADEFAVKTTSNKNDFINALKKLSKDNLSNLTPHPFYVFINYSHPTVMQRIKAIKNKE